MVMSRFGPVLVRFRPVVMRFRPVRLRVDDDWFFELICVLIIEVLVWEGADQFYKVTCMNVGRVNVCI